MQLRGRTFAARSDRQGCDRVLERVADVVRPLPVSYGRPGNVGRRTLPIELTFLAGEAARAIHVRDEPVDAVCGLQFVLDQYPAKAMHRRRIHLDPVIEGSVQRL